MPERYHTPFSPDTPYANVVELVARHHQPGGGVVVDVGCGYGAVAEPLGELGLGYLGLDLAPDGLADLARRGFEAIEADLTDPGRWVDDVVKALDGRPMAAVLALDIVEHLTDPGTLISGLRGLADLTGPAPLVVCMPNVAHVDLGVKLVLGRWDITPTGLLDATHVSLYTEDRLTRHLARGGWRELDRVDYHLSRSDQHQPEDCVALSPATVLGAFLREIREGADANATVNQFVRAYAPVLLPDRSEQEQEEEATGEPPFLSVIVRTQGGMAEPLANTLRFLAAQTCLDFEVVMMVHDIDPGGWAVIRELVGSFPPGPVSQSRLVAVRGGGRVHPLNAGVTEATGRYVAVLDEGDLAFARWVKCFRGVAEAYPGRIVRSGVATQPLGMVDDAPTPAVTTLDGTANYPTSVDLPSQLFDNFTPLCGVAIPRSCFRDLGLSFDEHLPVLEEWDLLLRASQYCGVASTGEVTSLYRQGATGPKALNLHSEDEWTAAKATVLAKLERRPYLLSGDLLAQVMSALEDSPRLQETVAGLRSELATRDEALGRVQAHAAEVERARADAEARYADIRASRSWRATGVLRGVGRLARLAKNARSR
jgi:SAM-dependent methyltransferase